VISRGKREVRHGPREKKVTINHQRKEKGGKIIGGCKRKRPFKKRPCANRREREKRGGPES